MIRLCGPILPLGIMFWTIFSLSILFCKTSTLPTGIMIKQTWTYTSYSCFHTNQSFFGQLTFEKSFKDCFPLICEKYNPFVPHYPQGGSWFERTWIYTTWWFFHTVFGFSGQMSFDKNIEKPSKLSIMINDLFFERGVALNFYKIKSNLPNNALVWLHWPIDN